MAINFLPWREAEYAKKQQRFLSIFLMGLVLTIAIIWIMNQHMKQKKQTARQAHQLLLEKIQIAQNRSQEVVFNGDQKKQEKLLWISGIFHKEHKLALFLERLGKMDFRELYLTNLSFEKGELKLQGIAVSILKAFYFMSDLKQFPELKQVQFLGAETLQEGVQFALAAGFN